MTIHVHVQHREGKLYCEPCMEEMKLDGGGYGGDGGDDGGAAADAAVYVDSDDAMAEYNQVCGQCDVNANVETLHVDANNGEQYCTKCWIAYYGEAPPARQMKAKKLNEDSTKKKKKKKKVGSNT